MGFFNPEDLDREKTVSKKELQNHIISEEDLKSELGTKRNVLLLEPPYKRKFLPLGLAKISSFIKQNGGRTTFANSHIKDQDFDCVCIETLFTYDSRITLRLINDVVRYYKHLPIIIGGVYASLMPKHILSNINSTKNVKIFRGVSEFLDNTPADYETDWHAVPPWNEASFVFTTRGCVNNCAYCCVNKLEPESKIIPTWKDQVSPNKKGVVITDNNCSAFSREHLVDICDFVNANNKQVMFNSGFDCKWIDDDLASIISKVRFFKKGVRMAFDRIEEDGVFQKAAEILLKHGINKFYMTAYVLFNFKDTPKEADYRAREVLRLIHRPYPQRYIPLNAISRTPRYVGKHWSDNLAKAFNVFWLNPGLFENINFQDWIKTTKKAHLTEEDISLYEDC